MNIHSIHAGSGKWRKQKTLHAHGLYIQGLHCCVGFRTVIKAKEGRWLNALAGV